MFKELTEDFSAPSVLAFEIDIDTVDRIKSFHSNRLY